MATKMYIVERWKAQQGRTKPLGQTEALETLKNRAGAFSGPWEIRLNPDGEKAERWSDEDYTRFQAVGTIRKVLLPKSNEGDIIAMRSDTDDVTLRLRVVYVHPTYKVSPTSINGYTSASPSITKFVEWVCLNFEGFVSWGICNCRMVRGSTTTWSQHSDYVDGCNAIDLSWTAAAGKGLIDRIIAKAKMEVSHLLSQIIWRDGGAHETHGHFSGEPYRSGTPRCA